MFYLRKSYRQTPARRPGWRRDLAARKEYPVWVAECSTYEKAIGKRRPVVVHLFFGDTRIGALAVMKAHSMSDSFFRGCTNKGKYLMIDCWTECNVYERA